MTTNGYRVRKRKQARGDIRHNINIKRSRGRERRRYVTAAEQDRRATRISALLACVVTVGRTAKILPLEKR